MLECPPMPARRCSYTVTSWRWLSSQAADRPGNAGADHGDLETDYRTACRSNTHRATPADGPPSAASHAKIPRTHVWITAVIQYPRLIVSSTCQAVALFPRRTSALASAPAIRVLTSRPVAEGAFARHA